ncbi:hypothetical protein DFH11DRAFT_852428 [Phellopilus nigrolimitatus]|nr:hypothetical protein DFH11DRAFT_852428 [Phellopilus nigrolimitatus]
MSLSSAFTSIMHTLEMLVLSWTSHARLWKASEPSDYDEILKRTIREVKFHSETFLAILFFMGTSGVDSCLISWTLACLLYTLITYMALEAMSGDALHKWIDEIPCGRVFLACLTKLPALTVIWTLCALALSQWNTLFTTIVLCSVAGVLVLALAVRLRLHAAFARAWRWVVRKVFRRGAEEEKVNDLDADLEKGEVNEVKVVAVVTLPVGAERV